MILREKTILITGVLTRSSIAYRCAQVAQDEGATVILTSFGRAMSLTQRAAKRLTEPVEVLELDVTKPDHIEAVATKLKATHGTLDGVVHAVGFAPESCLGHEDGIFGASWAEVATALEVSTFSLVSLAGGLRELYSPGSSIVGLDFDASVTWPGYDWMGIAKAALESAGRYLARDLGPAGVRVNMVAAGPIRTVAARSIPGFGQIESVWAKRAPLGWNIEDPDPVARAVVALLSPWFAATTGEVIHVDGGVHAVGVSANEFAVTDGDSHLDPSLSE